jgi:hypothetical protein
MRTRVWATLILAVAVICMPGCKKKEAVQDESQAESETTPDAAQETKETPVMSVNQESFGQTPEGREIDLYTLTNSNGLKARITNYGAILVSLEVPGFPSTYWLIQSCNHRCISARSLNDPTLSRTMHFR